MMLTLKQTQRLLVTLLTAIALSWTAIANANDSDHEKRARELMAEGLEAQKNDNLVAARSAYLESFEIYPSYDVAGNLGLVEVKLREYPSAANHLAYCLRHFPTGANRDLKKLVEENFITAKEFVGEITFQVNEPKATVSVDDEAIGVSPFEHTVFVRAGHHTASAQLGEREIETTFAVERGRSAVVALDFAESLPSSGLNGPESSAVPLHDDRASAKKNWVPAYVLGGVTVATFATSMVFRGLAGGQKKKADELRTSGVDACFDGTAAHCEDLQTAIDRHDSYDTVSDVSLVVTAVGAAATLGYVTYVLLKKGDKQPVTASFGVAGTGGTFVLSGKF